MHEKKKTINSKNAGLTVRSPTDFYLFYDLELNEKNQIKHVILPSN